MAFLDDVKTYMERGKQYKWLGAWHLRGQLIGGAEVNAGDMPRHIAMVELARANPLHHRYPGAQLTVLERQPIA